MDTRQVQTAASPPARVKYTFKGRKNGRYCWSADDGEGDICCGVKYFWNPKGAPYRMALSRLEKVNAIAGALWGTRLSNDVRTIAEDVERELKRMGYNIVKSRVNGE